MRPDAARPFSDDIAIDLGTASTLVHVAGRGILIDEPSVVAASRRRGAREILAAGADALRLAEEAPEPVTLIRPLRDGVVADFAATGELLRRFLRRARTMLGFRPPCVLIAVPAGATPLEKHAVASAARDAGARRVFLAPEPVAAALGAGLAIERPHATMVADIGAGTANAAVFCAGRLIDARSARGGGDAMDAAIVRHVRRTHGLAISEADAERIKIETGAALSGENGREIEFVLRGHAAGGGELTRAVLTPAGAAAALEPPLGDLAAFIEDALDALPPRIRAGVAQGGICLTGGGALYGPLAGILSRRLAVRFFLAADPLRAVITGAAVLLARREVGTAFLSEA